MTGLGAVVVIILTIDGNRQRSHCAIGSAELDLHPA